MQKRWAVKEKGNTETIKQLSAELNIDLILASLLVQREIASFEEARKFFRPQLSDLHDPFLIRDMQLAVDRVLKAISGNEKILVFGDYDVDGTTAVALVYSFIKSLHPLVDFYIPYRYGEGYGISFKGIDFAADNNFSLIIALDCGIKSNDKIDYAQAKNIDFIICDHHRPGTELPKAVAVLDPKRSDCNYPYDELLKNFYMEGFTQVFVDKNSMGKIKNYTFDLNHAFHFMVLKNIRLSLRTKLLYDQTIFPKPTIINQLIVGFYLNNEL